MRPVGYAVASTLDAALDALHDPETAVIAGGTELVNWLKDGIATPARLVDISRLPLNEVVASPAGLRLGAVARMSEVAVHPAVTAGYPVLAQALLAGASPQLRNMATLGGNLMQRTRCPYFRAEVTLPCNKRHPGSGCAAQQGDTHGQSIFGWSRSCVATHPSDLAVALVALDAQVQLRGRRGNRTIGVEEFHRLPGGDPSRDTELAPDELIVAIEVPADPIAARSHYLKVRERTSYEFALVSVAAAVRLEADGVTICQARLALGGVAPRPWRLPGAEAELAGREITDRGTLRAAIEPAFTDAQPLPGNAFKVELAQRAAVRALQAAGGTR